jgi:hypothetical protein
MVKMFGFLQTFGDINLAAIVLCRAWKLMSIPSNVRVLCGFGFIHHHRHHRICVDFGTDDGLGYIKPFCFVPEDTIDKRSKEDGVPYRYWRDAGFLFATPGNVVDYDIIEDYISKKLPRFWD